MFSWKNSFGLRMCFSRSSSAVTLSSSAAAPARAVALHVVEPHSDLVAPRSAVAQVCAAGRCVMGAPEAGAGRRAARTVHAVPPRKLLARLDRVGDVVHLAVVAAREPFAAAAAAAAALPLGS